tara:strand:+ start:1330 stop:2091 length:762 start_codon:yes stop_codon:yes gene_type:complete
MDYQKEGMCFKSLKEVFLDDLVQSFKDKRIIAVTVIYLIFLSWGMKKAVLLTGIWNIWLTDILGFGQELPFPIIFFYFASIVLLPIFSLLLSYDIISGESRTMRNLVYRIPRESIFFGKFLAIFLINIFANLIVYIIAIDFISHTQRANIIQQGFLLYGFLVIFALYFTSLVLLASTLTNNSKKSLFMGACFIIIPLLFMLSNTLKIISPFNYYKYGLRFFTESISYTPFFILIISSIVFIFIAYFVFKRKDL